MPLGVLPSIFFKAVLVVGIKRRLDYRARRGGDGGVKVKGGGDRLWYTDYILVEFQTERELGAEDRDIAKERLYWGSEKPVETI